MFLTMREKATLDDLYNTLSYQVWKTGLEIKAELQASGKRLGFWMSGGIYAYLHEWEDEGLITSRERDISEELLRIRSGIPQREYKRISTGSPERLQRGGLERELVTSES